MKADADAPILVRLERWRARLPRFMRPQDGARTNLDMTLGDAATEIETLRSVVSKAHDAFVLTFHGVVWNRLSPAEVEAVDRALNSEQETVQ